MANSHPPFLQTLRLTDFRNYAALDLDMSGAPVILFGDNGSGKTNLLEAVSLLSPGRGLRRAKLEDLVRRSPPIEDGGARYWGINAGLSEDDDLTKLAVGQVPESPRRRTVRIDGKSASGPQLAAKVTLLWLTPAQDRLFTGPASERRKFLDRFTLMQSPSHGSAVLKYEKLRAQRGRLLTDGIDDTSWYTALEADMAAAGAEVAMNRAATVAALIAEIEERFETVSDDVFPKAIVELEGEAEELAQSGLPSSEVEDFIRAALSDGRQTDMRAGRTLRGVHKSDLRVTHAAKSMPAADCSTGEQKALLIGLVLAQARAQSERSPFLLLDEVAAHLDEDRREALAEELIALGTQVFMTGTDRSLFKAFEGRADFFRVDRGAAEKA